MPEQTVPVQPAALTANLHVSPAQVRAYDHDGDVVSLTLGDTNARVAVLGDLTTVMEVVAAAAAELMQLAQARPEAAE